MKRILPLLLSLLLLCPPARAAEAAPCVSASAAILVDGESGRVLYAKNPDEERLIASITKLMTALVAVQAQPELGRVVTIKPEWTGAEGSSLYLRAGEQITMEALLYGLLLHSGNDAALAVAGFCGGDTETFVGWMNDKAVALGMEHTHFTNPSGLNEAGHYSSAADMALLARAVLASEPLARIVSTRTITIGGRSLTNHNRLLWRYEGCTGMKTGYTEKAGRTLVSSAERNGRQLIAVTLNDPDDWNDHAALLDYGFTAYSRQVLVQAGQICGSLPVQGSLCRLVSVQAAEGLAYPLARGEELRTELQLPQQVQAPVTASAEAGRLRVYLGGELVGDLPLCYSRDVRDDRSGPAGLIKRLWDWFGR